MREMGDRPMVNFSAVPRYSLLGKMLRAPLGAIPRGMVLPVLQGPLRGCRWIVGSADHGCWLGSFEFQKSRLLADAVAPATVTYDIGANVGYYTLLAARRSGVQGRVFAFEPVRRNISYLKRHLRLNRIDNVTVIEAAVADVDGDAEFEPSASCSMGKLASTGEGGMNVQVVTLDGLVSRGTIPAPNLMKVDVEGAEARVLVGAAEVLAKFRPKIFLATHGPAPHASCCDLLYRAGYTLRSIGGEPIEESDEITSL